MQRLTRNQRSAISEEFTGAACTLDGKPAKITGRLNEFATVGALQGWMASEFSWEAVARIMAKGGNFTTK